MSARDCKHGQLARSCNLCEAAKETRLVARASNDVQELIKYAADLSGATLSQFIIEAATAKANLIIETMKNIHLSLEGANNIFDALEKPPAPNKALLAAANRYRKNKEQYANSSIKQKRPQS